jgi:type II secretory pathway predicted ATPase ExeA
MYEEYWGFKEKPFENTPDPRFFFHSKQHEEAMMRLLYAVQERKGAAMLSGEYGGGKTLLSRVILSRLLQEEAKYKVALIINPAIPALDLLNEVAYQLGQDRSIKEKKIEILRSLNELLYRTDQENKHTVLIVDEAQAIQDELVFEELRMLLNFQLNERFLLTLLLLGQPELREKIENVPPLKQRLALRYHLAALNQDETKSYIDYRCAIAGRDEPVFAPDTYRLIYEYSLGVPRQINNLCDLSLVVGMGEKAGIITEQIVREIIADFRQVKVIA